ncbi:MAG: alpha/beta fold hydrolase [Rhodobacteraceae bacterium]|nr:alpha/beta fold hydrolase [Paracoccaceae bacterium]
MRFGTPGARPALLLHCSLGHSGGWAALMDALTTPLDAHAFDQPGHGRAPGWDGAGDYHDAVTAQAVTVLQGRPPAVVIGHSFGGTVALRLALEHAHAVAALVLIEPVLFAAARSDPRHGAHLAAETGFASAMRDGDHARAARAFLDRWGDGTPWDALPAPVQDRLAAQMPLIAASTPALQDDSAGMLAPGRIEALTLPVLLLHGAASPPVTAAITEALAARLPQARQAVVAGAGHMLPLTHPAEVAARIDGFLATATDRAPRPA